MIKLQDLAHIEISNVDKKTVDGEIKVKLCNFVDVYHNWAIVQGMYSKLMDATAKEKQIEKFTLHKGQIAITKDSETRDDIGVAAYVADDMPGVLLGYHCILITPNEKLINGEYLNVVFHSPYAQKYFEANASGSGQRYTLTNEIVGDFPIPVIEMRKQKQIGKIFSNIDKKISLNNSACADLEAMAKLLYDYWFVQFDFPDENGKPYKSSGGKMVWNEELKREIPEGWSAWLMGDHMTSARGVSYSTPDLNATGVPMLNLASFCADDTYKAEGIKYYAGKYEQSKVLKPYELIMCNTQQTALDPTKDIIGHCLLVPDIFDGDIVSSHHVNHLTFDQDYLNYLVYGESKTVWFHKYMAGLSSGTNILGMDFDGVYKYRMVMPPQDILKKFAAIIHDLEARKSLILKENQQLTSLRDFLLPMLMNGQVKVKEVV